MTQLRGLVHTLAAIAALVLVSSPSAFAADTGVKSVTTDDVGSRFEFSAQSNGAFFFNGDGSFGIGAVGASVQVIDGLQVAMTVVYLRAQASGENVWALGALVGPVINFPFEKDLRSAFFGSVKYGFGLTGNSYSSRYSSSSSDTDNSRGVLDFSVGKRFKLFEHLSYTPEFGYSRVLGGKSDSTPTLFRVVLFGFSVFFVTVQPDSTV
jgi:hypothetical protein